MARTGISNEVADPGPETRLKIDAKPRQTSSDVLFLGCRELRIEHRGEFYSLRQTSKGKLILTK